MEGNIHISTSETFMIDAFTYNGYCPVCCKENQEIRAGWIECHCSSCGNYFDSESLNRTVRLRRKLIGLSVADMANKFNLKKSTIKQYENVWPSKKYWLETQKMIKGLV